MIGTIINNVVTAILLKYKAMDHIIMKHQIFVDFVLNDNIEAIFEIIPTGAVWIAVDVMLQVKIRCAINICQKADMQVINLQYASF